MQRCHSIPFPHLFPPKAPGCTAALALGSSGIPLAMPTPLAPNPLRPSCIQSLHTWTHRHHPTILTHLKELLLSHSPRHLLCETWKQLINFSRGIQQTTSFSTGPHLLQSILSLNSSSWHGGTLKWLQPVRKRLCGSENRAFLFLVPIGLNNTSQRPFSLITLLRTRSRLSRFNACDVRK